MLVDSHCHLNYPEFSDIETTIANAKQAGIQLMQTISTKRSDFDEVIALAESHERIYGSIGIHPHEAESHQDVTVEEIVSRAQHPKIIGIGETGLDFFYEHSPREEQEILFRRHIEASRQTGLPLIVHSRDADEDTVRILHEEYEKEAFTGLIHCFSSTKYLSDKSLEIGFHISISGIITFKKAEALREAVKTVPLDKLLVETDAPYLAPVPYRGKPNQPAYTRETAECLADLMEVSFEKLAEQTTQNFYNLFTKAKPLSL
ncbi:MAG: TatD family hydrolase [Rickettsiales bacterium]|nr:TatD family hydrolase [Rickettsiales bacterium]